MYLTNKFSFHHQHVCTSRLQYFTVLKLYQNYINPLTPELNPSAQRCLTRIFTGDFAP
jgi:hypothetical protein